MDPVYRPGGLVKCEFPCLSIHMETSPSHPVQLHLRWFTKAATQNCFKSKPIHPQRYCCQHNNHGQHDVNSHHGPLPISWTSSKPAVHNTSRNLNPSSQPASQPSCAPPPSRPSCLLSYHCTTSTVPAGSPLVGLHVPGGPSTTTDICAHQDPVPLSHSQIWFCFFLNLPHLPLLVPHAVQLALQHLLHTSHYFPCVGSLTLHNIMYILNLLCTIQCIYVTIINT